MKTMRYSIPTATSDEDASEIIRTTMNLARSGRYLTAKSLKRAVQKALPQCSEAQICMAMSEIGKRSGQ